MSADNPPTYYFTGIQFNSAFYNGNDTLTQTEASSLYLLKNTPDTATALETFSGGIKTNSIQPATISNMTIGIGAVNINIPSFTIFGIGARFLGTIYPDYIEVPIVNAPLNIGVVNPNTLNLGTASNAINIGSDTIPTNMYGFTNLAINQSGTTNTYIETASTSTFNLIDFHSSGTNVTDYDSRITAYSGGVANGQGTIEIQALNTNITSTNTNIYGNVNIARNTGGVANTYIETSSSPTDNTIDFHSSGSANVNYDSRIQATSGSAVAGTGTLSFLAGTLDIQPLAGTAGNVNIKNGATASGIVNIASATGTAQVNIGAGSGSGLISIGNPNNVTNLNSGTVNITRNTTGTTNTYIETITSSTANTIDFHSSGTNDVNYDSRITATGGTATAGQGSLTLTSNILTLTTPTINANGTLTMGSNRNITLKTDGTAPTAQTQLGGTTSATIFVGTPVNLTKYGTINITTPGIYIFNFAIYQVCSTVGSQNWVLLNGANTATVNYGASTVTAGQQISFSGSQVIRATVSAYDLVVNNVGTTYTNLQGGYFTATRIA